MPLRGDGNDPASVETTLRDIQHSLAQLISLNRDLLLATQRLLDRPETGRSRSRSRRASPAPAGMCFYHSRFGAKAHRCERPHAPMSSRRRHPRL